MSDSTPHPAQEPNQPYAQFEEFLRTLLGSGADEVIQQMRERGFDFEALAQSAQADPLMLRQALAQIQQLLATPANSPVNTDVSHDIARQVAVADGDPVVMADQDKAIHEALSLAELWLDAATDIPPSGGEVHAWSRSQWVEATLPAWNAVAQPVASSVADALAGILGDSAGHLEVSELPMLPGLPMGSLGSELDPRELLRRMGSAIFGMQIGQAAGTLSREVFGATDTGLPLLEQPATVLLPRNVADFAEGLDIPDREVLQFLALREAAYARLFAHVPWLRAHILGLVESYARGITINTDELETHIAHVDFSNTTDIQKALSGGVFGAATTEEQQATLLRLETTLALLEGWIDEVTARAGMPHIPHLMPLREMMRRRRAAGGPAEHTFSTLVGLELRPRRSRDAAALWALIERDMGVTARDHVWDHPDLLPDAVDLDSPAGYAARRAQIHEEQADVDRALAQIFGDDSLSADSATEDQPPSDSPEQPQG